MFWINLPIGAIGLWLILSFLPSSKPKEGKIDLFGFIFFSGASTSLILFFMQTTDWGWASLKTVICLSVFLIFLFFLIQRERQTKHPFLEIKLLKRPLYAAININVAITQFVLMITVFQTIYFQKILGYTPIQTGFILFASSCPILFMAPIAGFLSDRFSPKWPISLGYASLIFSFIWLSIFSVPSLPQLLVALTALGMGIPLMFTPSYSSAISSVPPEKTGIAVGMLLTLRMFGGSMGLALITLFVSAVQKIRFPIEGERMGEITSFSRVHLSLACLLAIVFVAAFTLHTRKSAHRLPPLLLKGGIDRKLLPLFSPFQIKRGRFERL